MLLRYLSNAITKTTRTLNLDKLLYKVDPGFKHHGGELVAQVLKKHGVKQVFTLCGGHVSPVLTACHSLGITVLDTRHEASAAFAADAAARLTGIPGVCIVTAGPGLTNTITAVKNAQMAETPLIVIGGAAPTLLRGRGSLQDIDQISLFSSLCKDRISITRVRDIQDSVTSALHTAASGVPGPVFIEIPVDVLYPYSAVRALAGITDKKPKNMVQKLTNWYISTSVDALFAGTQSKSVVPRTVEQPAAKEADIAKFSRLISECQKPVAVLGSQATLPGHKIEGLVENVVSLGVPSYLGGMCRGLLGPHHSLFYRQGRKQALKEADLIILAGAVCDFRLDYGRSLNPKAKVIAINRSRDHLTLNRGMFWRSELSIQADVSSTLADVVTRTPQRTWPEWSSRLREREEEMESAMRSESEATLEGGVNPVTLLQTLDSVLTDNSVLIGDGGDFVGTASRILRPKKPLSWLDPGAYGTLGVGGGFALGVKAVKPDSEVWILWGDGSCGYSLAEVDSAVRHKLPFIAVIGNDACWGQIEREQTTMLGQDTGCRLAQTDYHIAAEGYGARGLLIPGDATREEIETTLRYAQELHSTGETVVVNVILGRSGFRAGSISL